jgi:hypothetical protein
MNTRRSALFLLTAILILTTPAWLQAQYAIDWWTLDGGGGTSSGGSYTLSGTIGQPDAGVLTGGPYTLSGGFWPGILIVPIPGGPTLTLTLSDNLVTIAWPSPSTGFLLEQCDNLATLTWTPVPQTPTDNGSQKQVTVFAEAHTRFFRLAKP